MKVGDYVRTNYGSIVKIEAIDEEVTLSDKGYIDKENIIKSSDKPIYLIEVGDIVKYNPMMNGYIKKQIFCKMIKDIKDLMYFQYQIQHKKANLISILTKEEFESMEYKVGE